MTEPNKAPVSEAIAISLDAAEISKGQWYIHSSKFMPGQNVARFGERSFRSGLGELADDASKRPRANVAAQLPGA